MKKPTAGTSEAALLAEYSAANDAYLAYDGYRWQSGSFLIAGVFVYWGFAVSGDNVSILSLGGWAALLIASLMTCWIFFAHHYRQLYMFKLWRLQEIEAILGMEQHLRFAGDRAHPPRYRATRPRGHNIDVAVYWLAALGTALLYSIKSRFSVDSWLFAIAIVVIVGVASIVIWRSESRVKRGAISALAITRAISAQRLQLATEAQSTSSVWWPF